jgi:hypothetical protein
MQSPLGVPELGYKTLTGFMELWKEGFLVDFFSLFIFSNFFFFFVLGLPIGFVRRVRG